MIWFLMALHVFNLSAEAPNQDLILESDEPESLVELILEDILPLSESGSECEHHDEENFFQFNDIEYCDDVIIVRPESGVIELIFCSTKSINPVWNDIELSTLYPPPRG
ncbi:MAG: hypothetical protein ACK4GL_07320 [Flavobacteriales bacterium]